MEDNNQFNDNDVNNYYESNSNLNSFNMETNQFNNNSVNNYYGSNSNLNRINKKTNSKFAVAIIVVLVLCISFFGVYTLKSKSNNDELYTQLTDRMCNAAKEYIFSPDYKKQISLGESVIVKFSTLSDLNLIEARIENPYYVSKLFNKDTQEKYYSMDNSIRVLVQDEDNVYCEIMNNGNDVNSPNLRLNGDKEIILAVGTEYADPGFVATDDYDGDVTNKVLMSGTYDPSKPGNYEITYTVQDSAGNVANLKRNVVYKNLNELDISLGSITDSQAPKIMLKGANPYCMLKGTQYVEPGVIATDNVDGDVTDRISVTNSVTGNLVGSFRIQYKVEDSAGNEAIAYRAVTVSTKCLSETDTETEDMDEVDIEPEITLGDIYPQITLINNSAEEKVNTMGTTNIDVLKAKIPEITLIGKSAVVISAGSAYIDLGATAYDKEDGDITSKIITDSSFVNVNLPGVYKVLYRVTDSDGYTSSISRIVTVKPNNGQKSYVTFIEQVGNITVAPGEYDNLQVPKAINESGNKVNVTTKIEDYTTKQTYNSINWNQPGKYRVIYTATHSNGTTRQTQTIVVTIKAPTKKELNSTIASNKTKADILLRQDNCNITEYDLIEAGVMKERKANESYSVTLSNYKNVACKVGAYKVKYRLVYSDGNTTVKSDLKTVQINVVEKYLATLNPGAAEQLENKISSLLKTKPGKVSVTSNSATPNDLYNKSNVWIGGNKTGIKLGFSVTSNVGISEFEYSFDGKNVAGVIAPTQKSGTLTKGVLNWTETGKNTIYIRAVSIVDVAGDWSDPINLNIDVTGPTIKFTHTWDDEKEDWHNVSNLTVEYQGVDKESGLSHFEYTFDDVKAKKSSDIVTHNESSGKITIYENTEPSRPELFVYVRAVDKAGNKGEWTKKPAFVNLDTVKPSAPTLSVTGNNTKTVKIKATFKDGNSVRQSGFGKLIYTLNGGKNKNNTSKTIAMPTNTTNDPIDYTVKVWAVDKAGNKSSNYSSKKVTVAPEAIKATAVTMKKGTATIKNDKACQSSALSVGKTITLTATPTPTNVTDATITWSSSKTSVATVDENGKVKARKAGTAYITAKINDVETKCKLTVKSDIVSVTGITLNKTSITLEKNKTRTITATLSPSNATNTQITWSSSDKNVATVNSSGKITAKGAGTATITAKVGNKTATVKVTVVIKATAVTMKKGTNKINNDAACQSSGLSVGNTITLTATPTPTNVTDKTVTWSSNKTSVATVDKNGKVTAIKAGTAYITAKINDVTTRCKLTVTATVNVNNITLDKTSIELPIGSTQKINATISPSNASNKNITWSSSNNSIATVDTTGKITAKGAGTATITATTRDGNKTATVNVKVVKPELKLSYSKLTLIDENTRTLRATLSGATLDANNVTWTSSNSYVATVDENGKVKAKEKGTATITASLKADPTITVNCTITVRAAKFVFIGNSKTYYPEYSVDYLGIPNKFMQMAAGLGYEIEYTNAVKGGQTLESIINKCPSEEDGCASVVDRIKEKSYDYAIMNQGTARSYGNKDNYLSDVAEIKRWLVGKNPNVKIYLRKVWIAVDTPEINIQKSYDNANYIKEQLGVNLIDDGPVFYHVYKKYPDLKIALYQEGKLGSNGTPDKVHQNHNGAYLVAACMIAEVFDIDPTRITYDDPEVYNPYETTLKQAANDYCYRNNN